MIIGLTGGIGSGKSSAARILSELGAVVIDADAIAREVVAPGTPGLEQVVAEFGAQFRSADGSLDRGALAAVVFADPAARARLEAITHPLVGERTAELVAAAGDRVVVHDVPLLVELGMAGNYAAVVVVEAPRELRLARLLERGLSREDAERRMASQAGDAERRAVANYLIDNSGTLSDLHRRVDRLWRELSAGVMH